MSNQIYFTPGPSQLFYTYENHIKNALREDVPSISHRSNQFIRIISETIENLNELFDLPNGYSILFLNSANEAWDRIIQNLVENSSHHFANGSFSKKFHDFALSYNMKSTVTEVEDGTSFPSFDIPDEAELIGLTKNETSIGYQFTEQEVEQIRLENPEKIIALDMVSAAPSVKINIEQVDTAYLSVQKAFGMPAGLALWIVNEKCLEKAKKVAYKRSIGSYRSLPNLIKFARKNQTPETPNMLAIYILGKIAKDMLDYGKQRIINDTIYKATVLKSIDKQVSFQNFVKSEQNQSLTTLVFDHPKSTEIIKRLSGQGLVLGAGYGPHKEKHIRIANFPTHSKESIELLHDTLTKIE